jgi:hypothetical protein
MAPQPTKDDKLSFGLWIVGWQTPDLFGPLDRGETYEDLVSDKHATEDFDIEHRGPGYGFARIHRLAIEHLLGVQ